MSSNAVAIDRNDYWAFTTNAKNNKAIAHLLRLDMPGERLCLELQKNPFIDFGSFVIDFNDNKWDFSGITSLNISKSTLVIRFADSKWTSKLKLFAISSIVWKNAKVQTVANRVAHVATFLSSISAKNAAVAAKRLEEQAICFIEDRSRKVAPGTLVSEMQSIKHFLAFDRTMFGTPMENSLLRKIDEKLEEFNKLAAVSKHQAIPDEYLNPLIDTLCNVIDDEEKSPSLRITAAAVLLLSQTGMRVGELLGLKEDTLQLMKGIAGEPDITYLLFGTFKGSKGNNTSRMAKTIINSLALKAYVFLQEFAKPYRERLETDSLIVTPRQKCRYLGALSFDTNFRWLLACCHDTVPCINTQERFSELAGMPLGRAMGVNSAEKYFRQNDALRPNDILVYPTCHQFRVTVATKLYESGVNLEYIRQHMSHLSTDITATYIRSDKEIERAESESVYRAVFGESATLHGPHAGEFLDVIARYINEQDLRRKIEGSLDEVISMVAQAYPLRKRLGGVCIKCGNVVPCKKDSRADEILCAYDVCPNNCFMYYMLDESIGQLKERIDIALENEKRGHEKAAKNERRKIRNLIDGRIRPELEELDEQIHSKGSEEIMALHPNLKEVIEEVDDLKRLISEWS